LWNEYRDFVLCFNGKCAFTASYRALEDTIVVRLWDGSLCGGVCLQAFFIEAERKLLRRGNKKRTPLSQHMQMQAQGRTGIVTSLCDYPKGRYHIGCARSMQNLLL
jgi:hypothetical protein